MRERKEQIHSARKLAKTRRCPLLAMARSSAYSRPEAVDAADLALKPLINEIHLEFPFYESRRIRGELGDRGEIVNRKQVQRLMQVMGIRAPVSQEADQPARSRAQDLSVLAQEP